MWHLDAFKVDSGPYEMVPGFIYPPLVILPHPGSDSTKFDAD